MTPERTPAPLPERTPERVPEPGRRRVSVVPHTHWDREWYAPFQTMRLRLVDLVDDLLPRLEADPAFAHFMLDGQMAVVDDVVAVRPDHGERIRRLTQAGRLSIGPWYTLPDEFLVSGETLVRNLQLGLDRAAAYGGAMEVGYLPDMFGHVAQMPQLLGQFGFEHAVLWRGVPAAVDRSGFWWSAPDGSTVRAEYLPEGYGNGASVPEDPARLVQRIDDFATLHGELLTGPILWMNGADHAAPRPWLGDVVARADGGQDGYGLAVVSLQDHLDAAPVSGLAAWTGELRSGARANLLMGVASNRVDVKQAAARAESALERRAEPLSALLLGPERWPWALLDEAWLAVIRNSAHDSVCACSVDEVCDAVLHRYAEATQIAGGLARRALDALGASLEGDGPVVVNPSARPRHGLVELSVPGIAAPEGAQVLRSWPGEEVVLRAEPATVAVAVQELEWQPSLTGVVVRRAGGAEVLRAGRGTDGVLVDASVRGRLVELARRLPATEALTVTVRQPPGHEVLAVTADVPGFGWKAWAPGPLPFSAVSAPDGHSLGNGLVTVAVEAATGTFSIDGHGGLGRLVDGGDVGDTYNWCPPGADVEIDRPVAVAVSQPESGPLRGRLVTTSTYRWPAAADHTPGPGNGAAGSGSGSDAGSDAGDDRAAGTGGRRGAPVDVVVTTTIELRAGEGFVRVATSFDNRCRDHRLRAVFPLPEPATTSRAECAFATVERGLVAEGGPTEAPLPTFPSRRFVSAGGLTVVHEGLLEYELVECRDGAAHALALTLLRATGMLSRGPMATRPLPAGPLLAMEGPQLQGPVTVRYAVHAGEPVDPYALADDILVPLQVARAAGAHPAAGGTPGDGRAAGTGGNPAGGGVGTGRTGGPGDGGRGGGRAGGRSAASGQALRVAGAVVSAVRRAADGSLEVRVFNPSAEVTTVTVAGRAGWLVDLRGRRREAFTGSFDLGPWRIATAHLTDPP